MILTLIISCITIIALILSVLLFPKITIRGKELNTYWMVGLLGMILLIIQSNSYRPLSKTVRFNVIGHEPQKTKGLSNIRKQFRMF